MMFVTIEFATQLRMSGLPRSSKIEIGDACAVDKLLTTLRSEHVESLGKWISEQGEPASGLMVFVNDAAIKDLCQPLCAGDRVTLMSLVSGG